MKTVLFIKDCLPLNLRYYPKNFGIKKIKVISEKDFKVLKSFKSFESFEMVSFEFSCVFQAKSEIVGTRTDCICWKAQWFSLILETMRSEDVAEHRQQ